MEHQFPLIAREEVAEGTMAFTFHTQNSGYTFKAGQHADYTLINPLTTDSEGNTRTFSFVNSPLDSNKIVITTRMRNTAFKNNLRDMPLNTLVKVSEPMGRFTLHKDESIPAVLLAGGIGITPFMSIIETAIREQTQHKITLLYSNRTIASAAFLDKLEDLSKTHPNVTFVPTLTDESADAAWQYERGTITMAMIQKHVPAVNEAIFYVAGPPAMVNAMTELLETHGIAEERIKTEDFAGY